ncbi:MAG: hypothetical protein MUD06_11960, partial [Rhodospirillales bacterium]|nr:hypothetical protein [Rhodospirillales bacterium]
YARTEQGPHHHPEIAYVIDGVTGVQVPRYTDEAMLQALRAFLAAYPRPREAFAATINRYVAEHLSLDSMVREFARVDDFISRRSRSRERSAEGEPAAAAQRGG